MEVKNITIEGFRGFSESRTINFAIPNGKEGSGLTVLVGPNNSGKSTIIETIYLLSSFIKDIPKSARNEKTGGNINIKMNIDDNNYEMLSYFSGGSSVFYRKNNEIIDYDNELRKIFILSSHRYINSSFGNSGTIDRYNYRHNGSNGYRNIIDSNNFGGRLRNALIKKKDFDSCLKLIYNSIPKWYLDTDNYGNQFLEFDNDGIKSISSGSGDGIINIFNIIDSIYDSSKNEPIFIDEPEKSIHPALQKKLLELLIKYSKDRQIIITTHSPYFINWNNIVDGGMKIIRIANVDNVTNVYEISNETKEFFKNIIKDYNNPHLLGINATESFFLDDNIILVEGQDDVVGYKRLFEKYNFVPNASFYGWGAGGFEKIEKIVIFLKEIGYKSVLIIADLDKKNQCEELQKKYNDYFFITIPCKDIRRKTSNKVNRTCKEIEETIDISEDKKKEIINIIEKNFYPDTFLIEDVKNLTISKENEHFIKNMMNMIKEYFKNDEDENEDNFNKDLEIKANISEIVYKNLNNNPIMKELNKLHKDEEGGGFGGIIGYEKIEEHKYKVFVEFEEGRKEKVINATLEYLVDISNKAITLESYVINNNTFDDLKI